MAQERLVVAEMATVAVHHWPSLSNSQATKGKYGGTISPAYREFSVDRWEVPQHQVVYSCWDSTSVVRSKGMPIALYTSCCVAYSPCLLEGKASAVE